MSSDEAAANGAADFARNLGRVRARIAEAAQRAGRKPDEIGLVAVTKTVTAERIAQAAIAGGAEIAAFGENYVQEARAKIPLVAAILAEKDGAAAPPPWHLIGHLQKNKAKVAVELFAVVESVDSFELAAEIDRQALRRGRIQPILIEVKLARDADTRPGVLPENALDLAARISGELPHVKLDGLMGIAPPVPSPEEARPHFAALRTLWEKLPDANRQTLSMGMSGDFEVAVQEGATLVRIGTALFGTRKVNG